MRTTDGAVHVAQLGDVYSGARGTVTRLPLPRETRARRQWDEDVDRERDVGAHLVAGCPSGRFLLLRRSSADPSLAVGVNCQSGGGLRITEGIGCAAVLVRGHLAKERPFTTKRLHVWGGPLRVRDRGRHRTLPAVLRGI